MLKKFKVIKEMLATVSKYSFKKRTAHVLFLKLLLLLMVLKLNVRVSLYIIP